ncbi:hypothetical protein SDRG_00226 [Saprolegnia diclina VS20]|uniref:Uncharacterized protein n=1 Tax=Saprolegnia diclina (strain VS20) TaxID=1156394 RepID=T0SAX3_SAPDV|nr:hypothetical protein SDRG_00226 [Saprolegnia diclina VS20]EQC42493.1 hypothetical protein SDRG_00226 [Saprolegnia diclina VS20]|eukprot:XP_008603916.1 hypothetical protein SDRG_00226 [Saprolegnia diclina VS20]
MVDDAGVTPLLAATTRGHRSIVRLLLQHGAHVTAVPLPDATAPLVAAATRGDVPICTLLLNHGADTALHIAVRLGHIPLAQLLLDYNAHVDARPTSMTPLLLAVQRHHVEMIKLLLRYGANPTLVSKAVQLSPLQMARQKGYIGLVMLLRHLAPLHFSVRTTRMGLIERLLHRTVVAPGGRFEDEVFVSFADRSDTTALLFTAVHCNNVAFARRLLSRGVDPNVASTAGFTPLLLAVARNLLEMTRELLEANADTELPNHAGVVPLWAAYNNNDLAMTRLLLDYDADPNASFMGGSLFILAAKQRRLPYLELLLSSRRVDVDQNGRTGFEYACVYGDLDCVRLLVRHGVNATAAEGKTLLMFAAKYGAGPIVSYLLPLSDVNAVSNNGYSAVAVAAYYGHLDVVRLLVAHGAVLDPTDKDAVFPLRIAAQEGHARVVEYLVSRVHDVDRRNCFGDTALYMAAQNQHVEVVRCLCTKANVNLAMEDGSTSLWRACLDGSTVIVDLLVQHGADINMASFDGNRPLVTAAEKGHFEVVLRLLDDRDSVDVDATNQEGKTALYQASCFGHVEICRALLKAHATVTVATTKGVTPIVIAIVVQNADVVELLLPSVRINEPLLGSTLLHMAIQRRSVRIVEVLVAHGADLEALDKDGRSPLVLAAHLGSAEILHQLAPAVSNIDAVFQDGYTALSVAVEQGHLGAVEALVQHGASLAVTTEIGLTLLHLASFSGWRDVAAYLLERGANALATDKIGGRSITYAVTNGHADVVALLLPHAHVNAVEASTRPVVVVAHDTPSLCIDLQTGFSLLHLAVSHEHMTTMAVLCGAETLNVNQRDPVFGLTALHIACACGHVEALELLLGHPHASVNALDLAGRTPLIVACQYGHAAIVASLLSTSRPHRTAETLDGKSAFAMAVAYGHKEIAARLILEHDVAVQIAHDAL